MRKDMRRDAVDDAWSDLRDAVAELNATSDRTGMDENSRLWTTYRHRVEDLVAAVEARERARMDVGPFVGDPIGLHSVLSALRAVAP